jgi:Zn-dependent protease with chaperone function
MHKLFKARFYDGVSSQAYTVDVSLEDNALRIDFFKDSISQTIIWDKKDIKEVQYSSSIISLKYGDQFPYQQIDVTDKNFINEYRNHFKVSAYNRIAHSSSRGVMLSILVGFVGLALLSYFYLLPFLADVFARSFPKEYEISLGEKLYESVLAGEEIDSAKTVAINHFFNQLKIEGDYPVKITVVEKNITNAFALPGGGIVVYDKIIDEMDTYEELAALLAHEYSHVQLKHATRNIFRSLSGYLFISMLFGDVSGVSAVVIQNADNLRSLKYGRSLEHEADENGLHILKANKIDANGMAELFKKLKKESSFEMAEMLSSHPDIDARIDFVDSFQKEESFVPEKNDSLAYYFNELKQ